MNDHTHQLAQAAAEAASAPAVKMSATAATAAVSVDWFFSGPGMIALASLAFTAATFLINLLTAYRKEQRAEQERREQAAINAARLARLQAGLDVPEDSGFQEQR